MRKKNLTKKLTPVQKTLDILLVDEAACCIYLYIYINIGDRELAPLYIHPGMHMYSVFTHILNINLGLSAIRISRAAQHFAFCRFLESIANNKRA